MVRTASVASHNSIALFLWVNLEEPDPLRRGRGDDARQR